MFVDITNIRITQEYKFKRKTEITLNAFSKYLLKQHLYIFLCQKSLTKTPKNYLKIEKIIFGHFKRKRHICQRRLYKIRNSLKVVKEKKRKLNKNKEN